MQRKALLSIGLGIALASGAALAQNVPSTDSLTKPITGGDDSKNSNAPKTKSTGTAQEGSNKVTFGGLDINTDRKLSRDEVRTNSSLTADFDKLDANRDGSLSNGEFAKFEASGSDEDKSKSQKEKAKDKYDQGEDKAKQTSRDAERKAEDATD